MSCLIAFSARWLMPSLKRGNTKSLGVKHVVAVDSPDHKTPNDDVLWPGGSLWPNGEHAWFEAQPGPLRLATICVFSRWKQMIYIVDIYIYFLNQTKCVQCALARRVSKPPSPSKSRLWVQRQQEPWEKLHTVCWWELVWGLLPLSSGQVPAAFYFTSRHHVSGCRLAAVFKRDCV